MANHLETFFLPAEHQLTITTDAQQTGTLTLINNPGEQSTSKYVITASNTVTKGPYAEGRTYLLESDTVELTYSIAIKLDFENESLALTAPDLNTPNIDGGTIDGTDITDSDISGGTLDGASLTDCDIINPLQTIAEDGAITLKFGLVNITKVTAAAITLAAPLAQDAGKVLIITSSTAAAHTITATGLIQDGVLGGLKDVITCAAFAGSSITLVAINLKWHVLNLNVAVIT